MTYADAQKTRRQRSLNAYVKTDAPPEFLWWCADIKRGIIPRPSVFDDMKRALSIHRISSEEYAKRYLYEIAGDEAFIGDQTENILRLRIHLPDSLAKQIANRSSFNSCRAFPRRKTSKRS